MAAVKDKLIELAARNIAKEKYGNTSKSAEFLIDAELLLKQLFLDVLIEKSKSDPLEYITFLENVEEICNLDFYDVYFIEHLVFGD